MKRTIAFILLLALLASSTALADFSLSYFRNNDWFDIDVDYDRELAFIVRDSTVSDRSFTHSYESKALYSTYKFDIIVIDYFSTKLNPIFRLWFDVCTDDDFKYITSVSFIINGTEYEFGGVGDKEWYYELDNGYKQQILIKFGTANFDFLKALVGLADEWYNYGVNDSLSSFKNYPKVVFHGSCDIEATLEDYFMLDLYIFLSGIIESDGAEMITDNTGTKMTTKTAS